MPQNACSFCVYMCSALSIASVSSKCGIIISAPADMSLARFFSSIPSPVFSFVATPTAYPPSFAVSSISTNPSPKVTSSSDHVLYNRLFRAVEQRVLRAVNAAVEKIFDSD